MYRLTQGLRVVSFRWDQVSWQHSRVERNLLLNLYREGKTYGWFVSSCLLREIKMSGTCSLFPPFGDPWPSCLLPSQLLWYKNKTHIYVVYRRPTSYLLTLTDCKLWGRRIVWCTLTSWYQVSFLSVSIINVSDIFLVGFWSWEISFMWGCWGWQAAGTWVSVSREMVGFPAPIG